MSSLINVIKTDNEINGVIAIRLIMEIHKSFKASLPTSVQTLIVQPLIDIFLQFYGNFEKIIEKYLGKKPRRTTMDGTSSGESINSENTLPQSENDLIPSMESCKFMLELPIFIIFIFRSYIYAKGVNTNNFNKLVEKMYDIFNYEVSVADSVMSTSIGKERVEDFMLLRVKTISFLIYTSRYRDKNIQNVENSYMKEIPRFVIKGLKECPDECIAPRKEMLLVMRHIVEHQKDEHLLGICSHFMPYLNDMLDDSILIGKSRSSHETVRSPAYSTVLEILNSNQNQIESAPQISSCIVFCTRVLYDTTLGPTIHALAVGLMVALTQTIFNNVKTVTSNVPQATNDGTSNAIDASDQSTIPQVVRMKELLLTIIRSFVQKIKYLSKHIRKLSDRNKKKETPTEETTISASAGDSTMILPFSAYKANENFISEVSDSRTMFKHLVFGLKTAVMVFNSLPRDEKSKQQELPLLTKLFRYGLDCFDIYDLALDESIVGDSKQRISEEEKEIFNNYSSLFTSLPINLFTEVFKTQFEYLYKKLLEGRSMTFIHIPSNILSSNQVSASILSEILLKFLLKRMDRLPRDKKEAQYMYNLYKLVFGSTVTFPKNESVLKNHMTSIVTACFNFASKYKDCLDYYLILRSLFNSIVTAKFDLLCKEFSQLLPTVLEKLSDLVNNAHDKETRNLFVELCLTVPSKLHVLCPYLYLLVRPILYALEPGSGEKAVGAALRNLELWVTSLRNESLEPILKPVIPDLLKALFTHLKPHPYPFGSLAMRLLAKLGGTHRQYMSELTTVNTKNTTNSLFFNMKFNGDHADKISYLPMDELVELASEVCFEKDQDIQAKKNAFDMLKSCALSMLSVKEEDMKLIDNFKLSMKHTQIKKYFHVSASSPRTYDPYPQIHQSCKTSLSYEGEIAIFSKVLKSIFLFTSVAVKENLTDCIEFTKNLVRHFAFISVFNPAVSEDPSKFMINPDWFFEVLLEVFEDDCSETSPNTNIGDFILSIFTEYVYEICDEDSDLVIQFGIWERLQSRFTKCLYQPEWYKKCVGAKGILFLCENITPAWLVHHESDIIRALFFSMKNAPTHMLSHTNQITIMAAECLLRACCSVPMIDLDSLYTSNIYEKVSRVDQAPQTVSQGEFVIHAERLGRDQILVRKRVLLSILHLELGYHTSQIRKLAQSLLKLCSELLHIPLVNILERFRADKEDKKDIITMTTNMESFTMNLATKDSSLTGPNVAAAFTRALTMLRNDEGYKETKDQKKIFAAKLAALKLMREALVSKELRYNEKDQLKGAIEVIGKFLIANNKEVVIIAKSALTAYICQFKIPKDALQHSQRQLTTSLPKYNHMNFAFLQTLSFFLKVCSQIFTVKIGNLLLDHLKKWSDKSALKHITNQKEKPLVAAEILSIFSIIPEAVEHLPSLVTVILNLENVWADEIKNSNPFVAPMAKYLNIYPENAIKYLFDISSSDFCFALSGKRTFYFIMDVLRSPKSSELRTCLMSQPAIVTKLLSNLTTIDFSADSSQSFSSDPNNLLILVSNIMKISPKWFASQRSIFEQIIRIWNLHIKQITRNGSQMDTSSDGDMSSQLFLDSQRIRFTKKLLKIIICYCNNNESETLALFEIIKLFGSYLVMDLSFVRDFFENQVGNTYSIERKEDILFQFLTLFRKEDVSFQMKSNSLKHIAIPIVNGVAKKNATFSIKLVKALFDDLYQTLPITLQKVPEKEKYSLKVDLLQLATLFVKYFPNNQVDSFKKSMLKFSYENCIVDDITTNQCAFVLISHLMCKIGLPAKVVHQVYIAFLKDCKKDSKSLVLPALDMIIQPVKQAELGLEPKLKPGEAPRWIQTTKKTLLEDSPSAPQLVNIWTIFIRHAESFYESRDTFVYKMINSLSKIGYSTITFENKKLYIQLVDLLISWEEKAISGYVNEDENEKKRKIDQTDFDDNGLKKRKVDTNVSQPLVQSPGEAVDSFRLKPQSRSIILNFLLRMCVFVSTAQQRTEKPQLLYKECIQILKRALALWKDETVSFSHIEKQFPNSEEGSATVNPVSLCCILEIMTLFVEINRGIIQINAQFARKLIPFLATPFLEVNRYVCKLFKTLLKTFDPLTNKDNDIQEFYTTIWSAIKDSILKAAAKDLTGGSQVENPSQTMISSSFGHLLILHLMCEHYNNDEIKQQYTKPINSLLGKVVKLATTNGFQDAGWKEIVVGYLELCVSFLADGVHEASYKHYSMSITMIMEKCEMLGYNILHLVVDIIFNWLRATPNLVMNRSYTLPLDDEVKTMKLSRKYTIGAQQKNSILARLGQLFEQASDEFNQLKRVYFTLLMDLYQQEDESTIDPGYARRIESCFMAGLKIESKELKDIKQKYISILNQKVEKTPFKRLLFVIDGQRWEPLSDKFWIKHALDLVVEAMDYNELLVCDPKMAKIPAIELHGVNTSPKVSDVVNHKVIAHFKKHADFLNTISSLKCTDFITPLKSLCRVHTQMAFKSWGHIFALTWNQLTLDEKSQLQLPFQTLLARDYHSKQYVKYPNVIQALLLGVNNAVLPSNTIYNKLSLPFDNRPEVTGQNYLTINPEMLKFIGKSFNAWSLTIPLLEEELRYLLSFGSFDEKTEKVCNSLLELYRVLKEEDITTGIIRSCDVTEYTKLVLSLEQRNMWGETQEALKELIFSFQKGNLTKKRITHTELQLWEDHWLTCSKKLQQWDELTKYAQGTSNNASLLSLECFWKNGSWQQMKEMFQKHPSHENQLLKIYQMSCLIMQDKETEAGEVYHQAQQLALQRWCALPSFMCTNHTHMLHIFQQLFELNESAALMSETKKPLTTNELKGFLTTWRDRLPNKWDDIGIWNDIFTWRYHLLKKAIERFDLKDEFVPHKTLLLNETIWTLHKFSKISRKQNFIEPALKMLSETGKLLPHLNSETSEVFVRIIEIIKSLLKDRRYNDVLEYIESDTIANTKLKTIQKMEILRLRGEVFSQCNRYDESYQTFAQSISYFPQEAKFISSVTSTPAWGKSFFHWALVLDKLFVEKWNSPTRHQKQKQNSTKHPTQSMTAMDFAENCVASYLLAIRYSGGATNHQSIQTSGATVRQYIGRVLWLLSFDESQPTEKKNASHESPLQKVAEKIISDIPAWMWIPWQQQLFSMLQRRECEASVAKQLVKAVLYNFPQSAFHTFRSFVHDLREVLGGINKKISSSRETTSTSSSNEPSTTTPAPLRSNNSNIHVSIKTSSADVSTTASSAGPNAIYVEYFTKIRKRLDEIMQEGNKNLFNDLETMYKELVKFKPETEEELTKLLEIVLEKCYTHNIFATSEVDENAMTDEEDHNIPADVIEFIKRITELYFQDPPQQQSSAQTPHNAPPKTLYIFDFQTDIIADILPRKERKELAKTQKFVEKSIDILGPKNLVELTNNLKKWIHIIQKRINLLPKQITMEPQKGGKLLEHKSSLEIEIPGQYELTNDREPFAERHEKILCLLPTIDMKPRRNKESGRTIAFRSVSGKIFKFFIQSSSYAEQSTLKTEEKVSSLVRHVNRLLDKDKTARSHNNVQLEFPIIVTTSQRIRLIREDYDYTSLEDIFYDYCESVGKPLDEPILNYWKTMNLACGEHTMDFENKLHVYQHLIENRQMSCEEGEEMAIPDNILKNYIRSICPSWSEYYKIRKTFAIQSAIYNVYNYLLHTKDRNPYKILISKNSGHLFQFDFKPNINRQTGLIERDDPTPFRLTRNMVQFLSTFGIEGYVLNTMATVAYALAENRNIFESLIQLFVRDELISYHNFNVDLLSNDASAPVEGNRFFFNEDLVKSCVQQNVDGILGLVGEMAPNLPTHLTSNPPQQLPAKKKSKKDNAEGEPISAATPSSTPSTPSSNITIPLITSSVATNILEIPPLNNKIYELIQQASSPEKLSMKDPNYYAWF